MSTPHNPPPLPPDEYYAKLPRISGAAAVLFFDHTDRVLLVQPTYKPDWEVPGGVIEADEYPLQAAQREIKEELGHDAPIGRLLAVDWVPPHAARTALVNFVFDGGHLDETEAHELTLRAEEIATASFHDRDGIERLLLPRLARRVLAAATARNEGTVSYLHHGCPPSSS